MSTWRICTDGGCPSNPGPGSFAFVIETGEETIEKSGYLPQATNNQAEYRAMTAALLYAKGLLEAGGRPEEIHVFSDSQLIVYQLSGRYRVSDDMRPFYAEAKAALDALRAATLVTVEWFRREHNTAADELCNQVLERRGIIIVSKKKKSPKQA